LAESDLIVARKAMEGLDDLLFVLSCAIEDVENDIAIDGSLEQAARSLNWLIEAARPLLGASERLRGGG
jgi:type VI protein secretion system component VasF